MNTGGNPSIRYSFIQGAGISTFKLGKWKQSDQLTLCAQDVPGLRTESPYPKKPISPEQTRKLT